MTGSHFRMGVQSSPNMEFLQFHMFACKGFSAVIKMTKIVGSMCYNKKKILNL
jgi:hypothetical protein